MNTENEHLSILIKVLLAVIAIIIAAGGAWYYHSEKASAQQKIVRNLSSIAQLKIDQIAAWRKERLNDGAILAGSSFLRQSISRFLIAPTEKDHLEIQAYFANLAIHKLYADILLVDPEGRVRLSWSGNNDVHKGFKAHLDTALREGRPIFAEMHSESQSPSPHFSVVTPVFADNQNATPPLCFVVMIIDPQIFLYPMLQSWPISNKTGETLLVRRDGNDVLFLNNLVHLPDAAFKLRIPLNQTDVPAVMAVLGRKGVFEGRDYRGVDVISILMSVPDSPWFMVAKVEKAEIFSEWYSRAVLLLALLISMAGTIGATGLIAWQRHYKIHYRRLSETEARLRASVESHSITLKSIGDGVISADTQGKVVMLNPVAETLTGWSQAEAYGKPLEEVFRIINEETRETVDNPVAKVLYDGLVVGLANHTLLITRTGVERPIADSAAPIRNAMGEIIGVVLVFRDQTEKRRTQQVTQARLALLEFAAVNPLDAVLTKALDETSMLVDSPIGFYHFVEADQKTLSLQQWSSRTLQEFCRAEGRGMHYGIDQAGVWVDSIHRKGPVIHNDYASLPHKKGLPEGHAKVLRELVVPIIRDDKVVAILGVGNKTGGVYRKRCGDCFLLGRRNLAYNRSKKNRYVVARERREVSKSLQQLGNRYVQIKV